MEINISRQEQSVIARLVGRLDTPASLEAAKILDPLQEEAGGTIVLDCSELSYISSSGLRIFLGLKKAATAKGGRIIIKGMCEDIRNVFMITGFLGLFQIEE